jgi:hypothetical protein
MWAIILLVPVRVVAMIHNPAAGGDAFAAHAEYAGERYYPDFSFS